MKEFELLVRVDGIKNLQEEKDGEEQKDLAEAKVLLRITDQSCV